MITVLYCVASVCAFAALYTFRVTIGERAVSFHAWYSAMCVFIGLFVYGLITYYEATSVSESAMGLKIQSMAGMGYAVSFSWFVFRFSKIPNARIPLMVFSAACALVAYVSFTSDFSIYFSDLSSMQVTKLPWGEILTFRTGSPHELAVSFQSLATIGFLWGVYCTAAIVDEEDLAIRNVLIVYCALQVFTGILGFLIDSGKLNFVPVQWVPALWLFVAVSSYFSAGDASAKQNSAATDEQLKNRETVDELTGLRNHQYLVTKLEEQAASTDNKQRFLIFIGFKDFEAVNHRCGHENGDSALIEMARRLSGAVTGDMFVVRDGGNRFALLTENYPDSHRPIAVQSKEGVWDDLAALNKPYLVDDMHIPLAYNVGIVELHEGIVGSHQALLMASLAFEEAQAGKGVCFYDTKYTKELAKTHRREFEFVKALNNDDLQLHMQPQISDGGELFGAEVLTRWEHPTEGPVAPEVFVAMAERLNLIDEFGWWLLRKTCEQMADWSAIGFKFPGRVAVNISKLQLSNEAFSQDFLSILDTYQVTPKQLEIEITESAILADDSKAKAQLDVLSKAGLMICIDDFGTGYSSLSYLNTLPVDLLKIDRRFVKEMGTPRGRRLTQTIINMAKSLQINVLAEE